MKKILMIFIFMFLLNLLITNAAITVVNVSNASFTIETELNISHTIGTGANGLMLVGISITNDGQSGAEPTGSVANVTYNGKKLQEFCFVQEQDDVNAYIYNLTNPDSVTANVIVTLEDAPVDGTVVGVVAFTGVNQGANLGTCANSDADEISPMDIVVSSAIGDLVFDVTSLEEGTPTAGVGQTELYNVLFDIVLGTASTKTGNTSVTMSWDLTDPAPKHNVMTGVSISQFVAPAPDNLPNVTLNAPLNNTLTSETSITFNASIADDMGLSNVSFYWNFTGVFIKNGTQDLTGQTSLDVFFNRTINPNLTIIWNMEAIDNFSQSIFGDNNFTLTINQSFIFPLPEPVITLIAPSNNSRNNTHPINISLSVSSATLNSLTCVLKNDTQQFDAIDTPKDTQFELTLDTGLISINQNFKLNISCSDNEPINITTTLLMNLTLDNILPIITPISPSNFEKFNKEIISNINIKAECSDDPVFKFNITIFNSSDTIFSAQDDIPVNNLLEIDQTLNIVNLGPGNYTVRHTCSDPHTKASIPNYNINKNSSKNSIKWVSPSLNEFEISYSTPPKNPVNILNYGWNKLEDRYGFWYKINASEDGSRRDLNFEIENKKFPVTYLSGSIYPGHFVMENNFVDFVLKKDPDATYIITLNSNANYEIEINTNLTLLNFSSVGELNTVIVDTQFEILSIEQAVDALSKVRCPDTLVGILLLSLLTLITFVIIIMGFHFKIGIIGFFGSLFLLVLSWFIAPCISIFGTLLGFFGIILMVMFLWTGLRIPTSVTNR